MYMIRESGRWRGFKSLQGPFDRTDNSKPNLATCGPLWHLLYQEDNHGETEVGIIELETRLNPGLSAWKLGSESLLGVNPD
jgi:hypothetical protein